MEANRRATSRLYWRIAPQGINVGLLDGSVNWRPEPTLKFGYPGAGGTFLNFRLME